MNSVILTAAAILAGVTCLATLLGYWAGRMAEHGLILDWLWDQTPRTRPYASIVEDIELGMHRKHKR